MSNNIGHGLPPSSGLLLPCEKFNKALFHSLSPIYSTGVYTDLRDVDEISERGAEDTPDFAAGNFLFIGKSKMD